MTISVHKTVHGKTSPSGLILRGTPAISGAQESLTCTSCRSVLRGFSKAPVFLLETLSRHPSEHLRSVAQHLAPLLSSHPRIVQFSSERDFVIALRRWKEKVKTLRLELDRVPEGAREDEYENWWKPFSNIVGILEGRPEIIQTICVDLNADWKEACAVWSIFVNHRLRRQDLPCVSSTFPGELLLIMPSERW